ncbi:MAG: S8 family serine peptidase, partial [Dehalococcoidia bacterium]
MRVRLIVMLGLITVFVAAGAGIFGLGGGASGPAVDVSHAQAPDEKVHREVVEALETQPWADVIVALREPPAARRAPLDLPALQQQVAAEQENMLSGLSGADFQVLRRYDSIPAVFGRVSVAGLDKLADHPNVTSVHPNIELHATLSESVPMINADDVHTMGYTGAGVTVAVLDTGIDTDHADLQDDLLAEHCYLTSPDTCPCGGTTAHGSGCAEDGAGHGSHVSGIITSGGVVAPGGVAPDAGIIAFKVLNDSGSGLLSDSLDALNYIIANPGDGVDAINMSLGSGPWTTPCDGAWPELTTAFNTLRSAGVTAFVSSGND